MHRHTSSTARMLAATILLAALPRFSRADTPPPPTPEAAITQGIAWLVAHQADDGSFSQPQFPGLSALALWAVAGSTDPAHAAAIQRGGDFLLASVQPDGGIYTPIPGRRGGGLGTYNTAISLTALAATGRDDITQVVLDARAFLAKSQHLGDDAFQGGFGYDKDSDRAYTDMMNTHFVLEAMRKTQSFEDLRPAGQPRVDIQWAAALDYADRLQNGPKTGDNAGGFFYSPGDAKAGTVTPSPADDTPAVIIRSYGSITYAGLLALVHCRVDKTDARVQSALDWASRHWTLEENPGMGDQGLFFFYNVISRALSTVGVDTLTRADGAPLAWRADLVEAIATRMRKDGSWVNSNGRFWENDPVLATAYSVLALQHATGTAK